MLGARAVNLRLLYPAKTDFKYASEIKTFVDKQKLCNFILRRPKHESIGGGGNRVYKNSLKC